MTVIVDFDATELDLLAPAAAPARRRKARAARPVRAAAPAGRSWTARRVGRILSGTALALTAMAAVAAAVVVVTMRLAFAPVLSPSMEPAFGPGDLLITKALPAEEIKVGDVLVLPVPEGGAFTTAATVAADAKPGDRYVHRVISVEQKDGKPVIKTKGDNNPAADPWALRIDSPKVPSVVTDIPNVGKLSLLTQAAWVRITLILMVAGFALVGIKRGLLDKA